MNIVLHAAHLFLQSSSKTFVKKNAKKDALKNLRNLRSLSRTGKIPITYSLKFSIKYYTQLGSFLSPSHHFLHGLRHHLMAKYRPHINFVLIMLLYLTARYVRVGVNGVPDFFRFYFTDLLFVPAMGLFALIFVRLLKHDNTIKIPWFYVLAQVILVSIYFEYYLPNYSSMRMEWYTPDMIDVTMYFLGGGLFLLIQRRC